jgi:hypothetical protein
MSKEREYFKMFTDILKEKGKYSQGRVYLLWSVFAYYITLGFLLVAGVQKGDVDMDSFKIIIEALEYAMTLFGGYVFGGKFISAYKAIKGKDEPTGSPDTSEEDMG